MSFMPNLILINVTYNETRVAVMENGSVAELYIERKSTPRMVGNVYQGVVTKVMPGMQAAFVDIGRGKSGFISVEDVREESIYEFFFDEEGTTLPSPIGERNGGKDHSLIQDVLKEGRRVIVQALKEPVGGKGSKLSSYIAIPGKYLVLLGNVDMVGVSRKIEEVEERERLKTSIKGVKPKGMGLIARTVSVGVSEEELNKDMSMLIQIWNDIKKKSNGQRGTALLYKEPKLYIKAVRDFVSKDTSAVLVDSEVVYGEITDYLSHASPNSGGVNVELYKKTKPIFSEFGVEDEIKRVFQKKVWLKSGGYIIIEEAEGLTVVDVNTGRYDSGKNQEETIYHINVEAASEIVRQIRLRNLVGIVVIDFIDVRSKELRDSIYEAFVEALKKDRAKSVVLEMSPYGVIQLTRQRLRESLLSELAEPCYLCKGAGYLKSRHTVAYEIIRDVKAHLADSSVQKLTIHATPTVLKAIREPEQDNVERLEQEHKIQIAYKEMDSRIEKYQIVTE